MVALLPALGTAARAGAPELLGVTLSLAKALVLVAGAGTAANQATLTLTVGNTQDVDTLNPAQGALVERTSSDRTSGTTSSIAGSRRSRCARIRAQGAA